MATKLTIKKAAESRNVTTQLELLKLIKEKTGVELRPSTMSAIYRDSGTSINKENIDLIMTALDITDYNEILTKTN